jgi:hypothetical protein
MTCIVIDMNYIRVLTELVQTTLVGYDESWYGVATVYIGEVVLMKWTLTTLT